MKKLTPTPNPNAEVWVPEDGVDRRTAASLEGAFQALLDRSAMVEIMASKLHVLGNDISTNSWNPRQVTRSDTYAWALLYSGGYSIIRWDLATMESQNLSGIMYQQWTRYNPNTGALFIRGGTVGTSFAAVYRSLDHGDTWTLVTNNTILNDGANYIGFSPTTTLIVGGNYAYLSSDDGNSWTQYTATADGGSLGATNIYDICWDGNQWWMLADGRVLSSPDGIAWTSHAPGWAAFPADRAGIVVYGGEVFVPSTPLYAYDTATGTWANKRIKGDVTQWLLSAGGRPTLIVGSLVIDVLTRQVTPALGTLITANSDLAVFQEGLFF